MLDACSYSPLFQTEDIANRIVTAAAEHFPLPGQAFIADPQTGCSWQSAADFISRHCSPSVQDWVEIGRDAAQQGLSPLCSVIIPTLQTRTYLGYIIAWIQTHSAMSRVYITQHNRRIVTIHSRGADNTPIDMAVSCVQSGYAFGLIQQHMPQARLLDIEPEAGAVIACSIQLKQRNLFRRLFTGLRVSWKLSGAFDEMSDELDSFSAQAMSGCTDPEDRRELEGLSPREQEVALLLLGGKSRSEIAEILHVALPTIKRHTEKIYRKLGVHSRFELLNAVSERQLP